MRRLLMHGAVGVLVAFLMVGELSAAQAVQGDIVFERKDGLASDVEPAVFPHWFHRIRYKCYVCHPAIFEMGAGANDVTMQAILAGQFCGACHDGKTAWAANFGSCNKCHYKVDDEQQ